MSALLSESEVTQLQARAAMILKGLDRVLLGQERLTRLVLTAMLAGGHVLLERKGNKGGQQRTYVF